MTTTELILTIAVVVLGTVATRAAPFILFPPEKQTPPYIQYLGKMLPSAALGLLVIFCFKDLSIFTANHAIPELLAVGITILLHVWKRQTLISIAGGTIVYMLLIQYMAF